MGETPDDRPPTVRGMEWASRVTAISLEMVLPGLGGSWIDGKLGTSPLLLILGVVLGMTIGLMQLVRLGAESQRDQARKPGGTGKPDEDAPPDDPERAERP
jgi:F0F1-type ATP synthase assembly protein I